MWWGPLSLHRPQSNFPLFWMSDSSLLHVLCVQCTLTYRICRNTLYRDMLSITAIGISFAFIEFTMPETAADTPVRFIAAVCYQIVSRIFRGFWSPSCPWIYQRYVPSFKVALHLEFPPLLPVTNLSQGSEGFAGSWGSLCFLSLLLHASAGKAQLSTGSGSSTGTPIPSGAGLSLLSCAHRLCRQGCPLPGSQLTCVPTKLQVLFLWALWREYLLKAGAKKGGAEDGTAEEGIHSPQGTCFSIMLTKIPEHMICFMPLPTSAKTQS